MARPLLAIGGIALIGVGAVIAFGFWSDSTSEASDEVTQTVRTVKINNDSGEVKVHVGNATTTTVHQSFSYNWDEPDAAFRLEGDELVLNDCGWNCSVDYDVVVPPGTKVVGHNDSGDVELDGVASADVSADSGNVTVRNVAGPVTAEADSGDVVLAAIGQDVKARASSGDITGEKLSGKVDAEADSGQVQLQLDVVQSVRAEADSGDVELTVPNGTYSVKGESDSGSRDIGVASDPSSTYTLQLDSDSGDVTVRAA